MIQRVSTRFKHSLSKLQELTVVHRPGTVILHELLHLDQVSFAGEYGANNHVVDWTIEFADPHGSSFIKQDMVYGALLAKTLARYPDLSNLGDLIVSSDENLMLYALAKYVQQEIGLYPHLPVATSQPISPPWHAPPWFLRVFWSAAVVFAILMIKGLTMVVSALARRVFN